MQLDDPTFRMLFAKGPVKRIGRDRFIRNVLYAIGNSGDRGATVVVEPLLADPDPTVRGAAVWALSRPHEAEAFAALRAAHLPGETEAAVRAEWTPLPQGEKERFEIV
ncbi:epoxyqueuosine reductase [mine drainage metagenome]|uniref:Epoxyqueuosine reductase n=1 Tax=mine drainage metagenome TaxID=410659 RepID=A0A1J5NWI4_9ZZZZ